MKTDYLDLMDAAAGLGFSCPVCGTINRHILPCEFMDCQCGILFHREGPMLVWSTLKTIQVTLGDGRKIRLMQMQYMPSRIGMSCLVVALTGGHKDHTHVYYGKDGESYVYLQNSWWRSVLPIKTSIILRRSK